MGFDPPGLDAQPDEKTLLGFASLMPIQESRPGVLRRLLRVPARVLTAPLRATGWFLGLPRRLVGRANANG